jgi:hypothetical protein
MSHAYRVRDVVCRSLEQILPVPRLLEFEAPFGVNYVQRLKEKFEVWSTMWSLDCDINSHTGSAFGSI